MLISQLLRKIEVGLYQHYFLYKCTCTFPGTSLITNYSCIVARGIQYKYSVPIRIWTCPIPNWEVLLYFLIHLDIQYREVNWWLACLFNAIWTKRMHIHVHAHANVAGIVRPLCYKHSMIQYTVYGCTASIHVFSSSNSMFKLIQSSHKRVSHNFELDTSLSMVSMCQISAAFLPSWYAFTPKKALFHHY